MTIFNDFLSCFSTRSTGVLVESNGRTGELEKRKLILPPIERMATRSVRRKDSLVSAQGTGLSNGSASAGNWPFNPDKWNEPEDPRQKPAVWDGYRHYGMQLIMQSYVGKTWLMIRM